MPEDEDRITKLEETVASLIAALEHHVPEIRSCYTCSSPIYKHLRITTDSKLFTSEGDD